MQVPRSNRFERAQWPQALRGAVLLLLIATGIAGTIFRLLSSGGWIARAGSGNLRGADAAAAALALVAVLAWFAREWAPPAVRNRITDLVLVAAAAAGFAYLAQLVGGIGA